MRNNIMTFIKGMLVGATLRAPGVSGGAVAVILGIYNKLLHCLNNVIKEFKQSIKFLAVFAAGAGVAFLALNEVLYFVMRRYPAITAYSFIGMLIASFPIVFRDSEIKLRGARASVGKIALYVGLFVAGVALVAGLGFFQGGTSIAKLSGFAYHAYIVAVGAVCGFVLIIPGVSFATILLVFGIDPIFTASLHHFDFAFLIPFGIGGLIGFALCAKIMYILFRRFSKQTYMVIMGFLLGSIVLLFALPAYRPADLGQFGLCVVALFAGIALVWGVYYVAHLIEKRRQQKIDCALIKETL